MMPMINEANAMSDELDQKMFYEIALISPQARGLMKGKIEVSKWLCFLNGFVALYCELPSEQFSLCCFSY